MRLPTRVLWLALFASLPATARAQGVQASISGTVKDQAGHPVVGAEVAALPAALRARTDSAGRFVLKPLPEGSYRVRVRRIGFLADETTADLSAHAALDLTFELKLRPAMMDTVITQADGSCAQFNFGGFNCRKTRGRGVFLTDDDIADRGARRLGDVFGGVAGFRVDSMETSFGREPIPIPTIGERCLAALVNGRPASLTNQPPRWADQLLGVEIYASPSDVPSEYQRYVYGSTPLALGGTEHRGNHCALVVYWTSYDG